MPRTIKIECPERPPHADPFRDMVRQEVEVQVVTPMFGGGVRPGEPDPVTLIRVPEIRGHLRFWWRATRGAACSSTEELRKRETEIWGDTENPSNVVVSTHDAKFAERKACAHYPPGKNFPRFEDNRLAYALFPFQGNPKKNELPGRGTHGISFRLSLSFPKNLQDDVRMPLWAWLNFGGLGARTRRGCGALFCKDFAPRSSDTKALEQWLSERCRGLSFRTGSPQQEWPVFRPSMFVSKPEKNPLNAWAQAIQVLRLFRQGENVGRNPGQENRPGRSRWPEPEAVRTATGRRAHKHPRLNQIPDNVYPRAEFGLPIIFHFKDDGEPEDTSLEPSLEDSDRFSSPLILKPLACSDGNYLPSVIRLQGILPATVRLKKVRGQSVVPVRSVHLSDYPNSPLGPCSHSGTPRSAAGSALDAFLSFITEPEQGFNRVEVRP